MARTCFKEGRDKSSKSSTGNILKERSEGGYNGE